jgi:hypothetical protein
MNTEEDFIHDLVNKMSMGYGKVNRVLMKKDKLSHDEIIEIIEKAKEDLDLAFEIVNSRKLVINGGATIK